MLTNDEDQTSKQSYRENQRRQGQWGSRAWPDAGLEKYLAMAVVRSDKGKLWFLYRLKISNLHILDAKVKLTADGKGISLNLPITANVSLTLWVCVRIGDLGQAPAAWAMERQAGGRHSSTLICKIRGSFQL